MRTKLYRRNITGLEIAAIAGAAQQAGPAFQGLVEAFKGLFGGGSTDKNPDELTEDDMKPQLRAWWNDGMGGKWLSDWIEKRGMRRAYAMTPEEFLPYYYVALMESGKSPGWWAKERSIAGIKHPNGYRQGVTEDAWTKMGVNWPETVARWLREESPVYVMLPSGGTPQAPSLGTAQMADDIARGNVNPYAGQLPGVPGVPAFNPNVPQKSATLELDNSTILILMAVVVLFLIFGR